MMTTRLFRFWLGLVLAMSAADAAAAPEEFGPTAPWARVLKTYVNSQGQVDFEALSRQPDDLRAYIDYVASVSPESAPDAFVTREARLAYYINSYNALAMWNVLAYGIPSSLSKFPARFRFFYWKEFTVGGRKISLYRYENDVIRPLGEERVHFALNCMVVACPRLPREPFRAEALESQLEREAREFFSESRNLEIDHVEKRVRVSEILSFYNEDFLAKSPSLIAYINRYRVEKIPEDYALEFISYDWTVNSQTASNNR
jgi:hypothetical protein